MGGDGSRGHEAGRGASPDEDGEARPTNAPEAGREDGWEDEWSEETPEEGPEDAEGQESPEEEWPELVPEAAPPPPPRRDPSAVLADLVPARVRAAAREGALRLDGLPLGTARLANAAVAATLVALAFLAADLLLGWWPGPVVRIPGTLLAEPLPGRLSIPAFILALLALATGAAALAGSAANRPGRSRRVIQVLLGLAGLEVGAALFGTAGVADLVVNPQLASVPRVLGAAGMTAGIALAASPGSLSRLVAWSATLAALPFAAAAVATAQLASQHANVQLGVVDDSWPRTIEGAALAAGALAPILALAGGLLGVLFLWRSAVAAHIGARSAATATAGLAARRPRVLAAFLGAKGAWLVAGYAGLLPAALAGGDAWARARGEDPAGIVVAAAIAAVAAAWLLRGARPTIPDSGVALAVAIFAVGFNAAFLVAGLLLGLLPVAALAGASPAPPPSGVDLRTCLGVIGESPAGVVACLSAAARDLIPYTGLVTWAAAAVVVPLLLLRRRAVATAVAVPLAAIVLWATPSAIFVGRGILGFQSDVVVGRPELLSVDAALTVAIGILAVLWWTGRQRAASPGTLTLILAVSTFLTQAGVVVPEAARPLVFGLVLVLTPLYGLVFRSGRLNDAAVGRRAETALRALGLELLWLAFLVTAIAFDALQTGAVSLADLLIPPVVAVLVGAEVARRERPRRVPARPRSALVPAARWAAAGAVAVAAVAAVLAPLAAAPAGPSDAARYAAFVTRVDQERGLGARALENLLTIVSTDPNGIEAAFVQFSALTDEAVAWVEANPPAACYAAEQRRWEAVVDAMGVARDSILSGVNLEASLGAYVQAAGDFSPGLASCRTEGRTGS